MKDILTVAKFTAKDMLGRKSFRISTIIIILLIVLGFNVPNIINGITGGEGIIDTVTIIDQDDVFGGQLESLAETNDLGLKLEISSDDYETVKQKITDGEINYAIIVNNQNNSPTLQYVVKNAATASSLPQNLVATLSYLYTSAQANKLGLSATEVQSLMPNFNIEVQQVEETEIGGDLGVMMIVSLVLFYAIYFCAFQVSSSITTEKTSKIIETLVTSTNPRNIVIGKTIGIGLVGLFQMALFIGTAIICAFTFLDPAMVSTLLDLSTFTPYLGIMTITYFILGYAEFALVYALTGSTVNKPEDIQSANAPVAILSMVGFYLAYFTLLDPTSGLNTFAAIFPISSPFCMPIRIMMGIATGWEVALSIIILLITILIVARIAIKIYSDAILNYGTKLSLKDLFKLYKQK